jgi:hypothetical protein
LLSPKKRTPSGLKVRAPADCGITRLVVFIMVSIDRPFTAAVRLNEKRSRLTESDANDGDSLERSVASIAENATLAALAATEVNSLGLCGPKLDRREACASVAAITEGLTLAQSTGTPVVALAGFNFHRIWTLLRDCRY